MIDSFRRFRTGHNKPTPMRRPQFPAPQRYSLLASTQPFRKSAPREHVTGAIRLVFAKFRELGRCAAGLFVAAVSGHQDAVPLRNVDVCKLVWKEPAYHSVMQTLHNPLYTWRLRL